MGVPSAQQQADILKDKGNLYFKKEKFGAAIDAYTEAITLCPSVPVYWTNRAFCERKRNEWEKVEADCRKALELDSHSVKAYYMLGLALLQYQQYEEAVKQLEKALDLGRGATGTYMVEEIWQVLAKARYAEWEADSDSRQRQRQDLRLHVLELLRADYERQLNDATASIKAAVAAGTQREPRLEVEDLIRRLDSGSKQGSNSGSNTEDFKTDVDGRVQFLPIYSDAELESLYRTSSEPVHEKLVDQQQSFDPLKHHKLSLRRGSSLSVRRQRSKGVTDFEGVAASPDISRCERVQAEAASGMKTKELASAPAVAPVLDSARPVPEGGQQPNFHSIHDVFKVFKEFMKLRQHEAGKNLLKVSEVYQRRSKVLEDVFETADVPDRPSEIPDHLCCKITMEIFRDPVITPSGISYERAAIMDHLRKVGKFDPFTRAPLTDQQVVPNLALKEAVHAFLDQHGWAYGPC